MKTLIVYYTYGGNTKRIAEMVHEQTGGDLVGIQTVVPYGKDYNKVVDQGQEEVQSGYCPEILPLNVDLKAYDTIILGTPVWWYTFAPAMHTFLKQQDFSGKTIYPFATNGGWIGHTFRDFEKACQGAKVQPGINIRFDENVLKTSQSAIKKWISQIK